MRIDQRKQRYETSVVLSSTGLANRLRRVDGTKIGTDALNAM